MPYCVHMGSYLGINGDLRRFCVALTGGAMFAGAVLALVVRPTRAKTRLKKMLAGRSAIVTGAGRGIGAAVSRLLGQHGASVLVNDLDEAAAHASAAAVTAAGESP